MVNLSKEDLKRKISTVESIKSGKGLITLITLENNGLVSSIVEPQEGSCVWLLNGSAESKRTGIYVVDLTSFSKAIATGKSDDVSLSFEKEEESTKVVVTTDRSTVTLIPIPNDTDLGVQENHADYLLETLREEPEKYNQIPYLQMLSMTQSLSKAKAGSTPNGIEENVSDRYDMTYIIMEDKNLSLCRYTRKNAMKISYSVETEFSMEKKIAIRNHTSDRTLSLFLESAMEDPKIEFRGEDEKEHISVWTSSGVLAIPVNKRVSANMDKSGEEFDVVTPAVEGYRTSETMEKLAHIKFMGKDFMDTMKIPARFNKEGLVSLRMETSGSLHIGASGRDSSAESSITGTIINDLCKEFNVESQDPNGITDVIEAAERISDGETFVEMEFFRPKQNEEDTEDEEVSMIVISTEELLGVAIWNEL